MTQEKAKNDELVSFYSYLLLFFIIAIFIHACLGLFTHYILYFQKNIKVKEDFFKGIKFCLCEDVDNIEEVKILFFNFFIQLIECLNNR